MKTIEIPYIRAARIVFEHLQGKPAKLTELPAGATVVAVRWTPTGIAIDYKEGA